VRTLKLFEATQKRLERKRMQRFHELASGTTHVLMIKGKCDTFFSPYHTATPRGKNIKIPRYLTMLPMFPKMTFLAIFPAKG